MDNDFMGWNWRRGTDNHLPIYGASGMSSPSDQSMPYRQPPIVADSFMNQGIGSSYRQLSGPPSRDKWRQEGNFLFPPDSKFYPNEDDGDDEWPTKGGGSKVPSTPKNPKGPKSGSSARQLPSKEKVSI